MGVTETVVGVSSGTDDGTEITTFRRFSGARVVVVVAVQIERERMVERVERVTEERRESDRKREERQER